MSQTSYLQQIAQRTSDRLQILTPPRSPFSRFDSSVPMEVPDEHLISAPSAKQEPRISSLPYSTTVQTEAQTGSFANPLIQSPNVVIPNTATNTTLEPSSAIASLTNSGLPNLTQAASEITSGVETPEPRKIPSLPSLPPRVAQDSSAMIASQSLQPQTGSQTDSQTDRSPDRKSYAITSQNLSQPKPSHNALTPAITESRDLLVSQPAQAENLKENFILTESLDTNAPESLRWLTPTIQNRHQDHHQDRNAEMPLPEPQLRDVYSREMYSEVAASPIALVAQEIIAQEHPPKGNTIHIGAIDIQILPVPNAIAPSPPKPVLTNPLARSFSGSFGLRQG